MMIFISRHQYDMLEEKHWLNDNEEEVGSGVALITHFSCILTREISSRLGYVHATVLQHGWRNSVVRETAVIKFNLRMHSLNSFCLLP